MGKGCANQVFCERLRDAMSERAMTGTALSLSAGITENDISRYRNGRNEPGSKALAALASALGVSMDWLWGVSAEGGPR